MVMRGPSDARQHWLVVGLLLIALCAALPVWGLNQASALDSQTLPLGAARPVLTYDTPPVVTPDALEALSHVERRAQGPVTQNATRIPRPSGTGYRVPDILDEAGGVLGEVKNVQSLSYTQQLIDYAWYAQQNG
ncbi:MAG: hypothetical protein GY788_29380 [bacterium]|nr:hypothetical protein [bacterium]